MKNISEAIQNLQDTETNLGEDHIHTEEAADRIHNQGNVELVAPPTQTSKTVQFEDCLNHILEVIVRCCCGYMIRPTREFLKNLNKNHKIVPTTVEGAPSLQRNEAWTSNTAGDA